MSLLFAINEQSEFYIIMIFIVVGFGLLGVFLALGLSYVAAHLLMRPLSGIAKIKAAASTHVESDIAKSKDPIPEAILNNGLNGEHVSPDPMLLTQVAVHVTDMSTQTKLVALNSAMEAARSGETGRGQSNVADEFLLLAARAENAANDAVSLSTASSQIAAAEKAVTDF